MAELVLIYPDRPPFTVASVALNNVDGSVRELESVFGGVRLRTDTTRRIRNRDNALYLVFLIVERLNQTWRELNGGANLMRLIVEERNFKYRNLEQHKIPELARTQRKFKS